MGSGVRSDAHFDVTRWCALLQAYERVVHNGAPSVPQAVARLHLTNLLPALDARAKGKPLEFFEAVLRPYAQRKRDAGEVADLVFFCRDFAKEADRPKGKPVADDDALQSRLRGLREELKSAEYIADLAHGTPDGEDAARNAERVRALIEQLTSRAA